MSNKTPSSWAWMVVHILFPLCPFFVEGLIRVVAFDNTVSQTTFNSATLAMSIGLLCLYVSQSLIKHKLIIPGSDGSDSLAGAASSFSIIAVFSFCTFAVIVMLSALIEDESSMKLIGIKSTVDYFVFSIAIFPVISTIYAQRSFKLSTAI
ncbi:hypothetical protein [Amphritea balenae]|uniref:Uncharacterized protein n=1 Tax=Amphritea balenae TaxID=452629 RepID=A0A3P1SMK4_9GAMM|nr:hypothetical protein [Amphritea balenae]RRC98491.1 hypothetical protein EHS89_12780 [Amphritea balenae]